VVGKEFSVAIDENQHAMTLIKNSAQWMVVPFGGLTYAGLVPLVGPDMLILVGVGCSGDEPKAILNA
jgi:hypothetical protein